jgi:hypothetical protein
MMSGVRPLCVAAVAAAIGLCATSGRLTAQTPAALPDAAAIIQKHVAALGGTAAFKAVRSMRTRGTFELTAQSISGSMDMLAARPNKLRIAIHLPGVGRVETCYDGKVGWEIDPAQGPALLKDRRLTEIADDAWFDSPLHEPDHVKTMTVEGQEEFDRRQAWKVKVVTVAGTEQREFFDVETGLHIGFETSRVMSLGPNPLPFTAVIRDYRKFGDLMFPTTLLQRTMGLEQVIRVTSIEYNTVAADAFEAPPAVKALIR